ncbi:hypothetical protein EDC01DRAFT_628255 [Geopyxis carbonaria]|nr:hypothetical protein EDC01DRAFT_628255 [Geopyxis carbonaria]
MDPSFASLTTMNITTTTTTVAAVGVMPTYKSIHLHLLLKSMRSIAAQTKLPVAMGDFVIPNPARTELSGEVKATVEQFETLAEAFVTEGRYAGNLQMADVGWQLLRSTGAARKLLEGVPDVGEPVKEVREVIIDIKKGNVMPKGHKEISLVTRKRKAKEILVNEEKKDDITEKIRKDNDGKGRKTPGKKRRLTEILVNKKMDDQTETIRKDNDGKGRKTPSRKRKVKEILVDQEKTDHKTEAIQKDNDSNVPEPKKRRVEEQALDADRKLYTEILESKSETETDNSRPEIEMNTEEKGHSDPTAGEIDSTSSEMERSSSAERIIDAATPCKEIEATSSQMASSSPVDSGIEVATPCKEIEVTSSQIESSLTDSGIEIATPVVMHMNRQESPMDDVTNSMEIS